MRLVDGAEAILGDLPASATTVVDVPLGAGSDEGSAVHRLSSIVAVRDALQLAIHDAPNVPIVIGGDCGAELGSIGRAITDGTTAVVWLDAHPDINTPESSPSGAFHGMVVRTLLGDGPDVLLPTAPLDPKHLVLAGTRALDDPESEFVDSHSIRLIGVDELTAETMTAALRATGATSVYLHIDLDVLDPAFIHGVGFPEPFGLSLPQLLGVIAAAKATLPLVGAGVTEFAPSSPDDAADDLGSILRIVGALAS
jgi:arginase